MPIILDNYSIKMIDLVVPNHYFILKDLGSTQNVSLNGQRKGEKSLRLLVLWWGYDNKLTF